ncbi:hypothetical protein [Algibacillus agarilyticus]|uniref:hypothetical protein n=1 Tax=Algibacillus agarilyticus TaxID=2234133 RepID=UPI000DCFFE9E|nr:hypothetical protein [Algibacillus agarilyticus]
MGNNFYASGRGANKRERESYKIIAPSGNEYEFRLISIPSENVSQVVKKSEFNQRSNEHLTLASVNDIYPGIKDNLSNKEPVKAYGTANGLTLLEGTRRSFCVSHIPGAKLKVWLTASMEAVDEKWFASTADSYDKPTTVDIAMSLKKMNSDMKITEIMEHYSISKGTSQNAKDISKMSYDVISLFPAIKYIPIRFLLSLNKVDIDVLDKVTINVAKQIDLDSDKLLDDIYCKEKTNAIKALFEKELSAINKLNTKVNQVYTPSEHQKSIMKLRRKGLKTKINNKGNLVLEIDHLEDELIERLLGFFKE